MNGNTSSSSNSATESSSSTFPCHVGITRPLRSYTISNNSITNHTKVVVPQGGDTRSRGVKKSSFRPRIIQPGGVKKLWMAWYSAKSFLVKCLPELERVYSLAMMFVFSRISSRNGWYILIKVIIISTVIHIWRKVNILLEKITVADR